LLVGVLAPSAAGGDGTIVVHLADGSSVPLLDWTLSYEYLTWPAGSSQAMGTTGRRDTRELWVGRKRLDTAGVTLDIEHRMLPNNPGEGVIGPAEIPVVSRLRLVQAGGRAEQLRPEAPHRELLLPEAAKGASVLARSLDLRGTTLGGTRRELCVISYTLLVQCGVERGGRVVKLEMPPAE
jgi:hypothetical protein